MTTRPPFYFAAPYSLRAECLARSVAVENASGWHCTSRWLTGQHDGAKPQQCAADDLEDLWNARAMICYLPQQSTRGGLWVEFGYALALRIPVLLVAEIPPNVFASIGEPRVRLVASLCEAAQALKNCFRSLLPRPADMTEAERRRFQGGRPGPGGNAPVHRSP